MAIASPEQYVQYFPPKHSRQANPAAAQGLSTQTPGLDWLVWSKYPGGQVKQWVELQVEHLPKRSEHFKHRPVIGDMAC